MKIEEMFTCESHEIEEDHPDQAKEYWMECLARELLSFIDHIADAHVETVQEGRVFRFGIAMAMLKSFQIEIAADLLRERFAARQM